MLALAHCGCSPCCPTLLTCMPIAAQQVLQGGTAGGHWSGGGGLPILQVKNYDLQAGTNMQRASLGPSMNSRAQQALREPPMPAAQLQE